MGCAAQSEAPPSDSSQALRLATTTSLRDSGLLDQLLPDFERRHHCRVDVVAVGTGAALKLGELGDADVVLVHARDVEIKFMEAGHGIRHEEFTENAFLILGPPSDPARIRGRTPGEALQQIAAGKYPIVSRGDDSGTHKREQKLWENAGGMSPWQNYLESGQGMGPTSHGRSQFCIGRWQCSVHFREYPPGHTAISGNKSRWRGYRRVLERT